MLSNEKETVIWFGSPTVTVSKWLHPKASVIVTVYVFGETRLLKDVVDPLDHRYEYGASPPFTVTLKEPSL